MALERHGISLNLHVVASVDHDGELHAEVWENQKWADDEAYRNKYCKGEQSEVFDCEVRLTDALDGDDLYTIFDVDTQKCEGLFRTKDAAMKYRGKEYLRENWDNHPIFRIEL